MASPSQSSRLWAGPSASVAWLLALNHVFAAGLPVQPRGLLTQEVLGYTCLVDMTRPVMAVADRQLSYQFMAAEALWILSGSNKVADIAPYNKNIAQFSDDGDVFFGAYGPWVTNQLGYVVDTLRKDRDSRQAVLTMWRQNPDKSKDVPCTIAMVFSIRQDTLHCHTFMRSSDIWLGLPYDIFNFSMIAAKVACRYNAGVNAEVQLGNLQITAASSHLYEKNWAEARKLDGSSDVKKTEPIPWNSIHHGVWSDIEDSLVACRDGVPGPSSYPTGLWRIRPWKE